jgi:hypothetical protein
MDTFIMTIPGNIRKFYRVFLRHHEKMKRKRKLTFGSTGLDDLYILWGQRSQKRGRCDNPSPCSPQTSLPGAFCLS